MNDTLKISTWEFKRQVAISHSTAWEVLRAQQHIIFNVHSRHQPTTMLELRSVNVS